MQMDAGLDTGDILLTTGTPITAADTGGSLQSRLAALGGELVLQGLAAAAEGRLVPRKQPVLGATYAAKIGKVEATIDWREPAVAIERRLRAFDPFPGARSTLAGEAVTCWHGEARAGSGGGAGEIVGIDGGALTVACGEGRLALTELQRAGGRRLPAAEFLRGRPVPLGARFG